MPDDDATPARPRRAPTGGRRAKFSLPADHLEEADGDRTTEHIEAFLDGPAPTRRTRRRHLRPGGVLRPRTVVPLESAADWERAMRHEDARIARYGRPASVLIVDPCLPAPAPATAPATGRLVAALSAAIRDQARETDRVALVGLTRFHVLLPETDEGEAIAIADRIARACTEALASTTPGAGATDAGPSPSVRVSVASPAGGGTLVEALRLAGLRLED